MKKFVSAFMLRGLIAMGLGPVVLAIVYLILKQVIADIQNTAVYQDRRH